MTREAALAALLRGKLEHGLLGGIAPGENRIELGAPGEPEILVSLPPPGRSDNDVRYPIALLGKRGLLTSDSTRIDGLVSVTDVATGRLRVVPDDDPAEALEKLDRTDRAQLGLAAAADDRARRASDRAGARAAEVRAACASRRAGRKSLAEPAAGRRRRRRRAAAAARLGLRGDPRSPTSSRWGSTPRRWRSRRSAPRSRGASTGSTTCSRRCCSRRRSSVRRCSGGALGSLVAALAFVTIGGNRFGADGGGIVVLAAAYLVLWLRLRGERLTWRLAGLVAAGAIALALVLLGLDAATGGSSHVTDAVGDGPVALAGDIADRIEISVRRTAAGVGATVVVLGSLAILVAVALRATPEPRARRVPRRHRGLARGQRHARRRARDGRRDRDRACPLHDPSTAR